MTTTLIRIQHDNIDGLLSEFREFDAEDLAEGTAWDWTALFDDPGDIRRLIDDAFEHEVFAWSCPDAGWFAGASNCDEDGYVEAWVNLSASWPILTSHAEKARWWIGHDSRTRVAAARHVIDVFAETVNSVATQAATMVTEFESVLAAPSPRHQREKS